MNKKKLNITNNDIKNNRPYYVLDDNENSLLKITKITYSDCVFDLGLTKEEAEQLSDYDFFDNDFLQKIKKESNIYGK